LAKNSSKVGFFIIARFLAAIGSGDVVLYVATRLPERVHVPAGVALDAPDFVLVLRNDDVRGIALALGAICLDIRADLVDLVFKHEVHSRRTLAAGY
jgi:hypothetical protein